MPVNNSPKIGIFFKILFIVFAGTNWPWISIVWLFLSINPEKLKANVSPIALLMLVIIIKNYQESLKEI